MVVNVTREGEEKKPHALAGTELEGTRNGYKPNLSQWEIFGRMKLTIAEIAATEGITRFQAGYLMKKPEVRAAYDKGRSQAILSLRQKQLTLALSGSERMLIYCGKHFANQKDDPDFEEQPDHFEPDRHSWDAEFQRRLAALRDEVEGKKDGEG